MILANILLNSLCIIGLAALLHIIPILACDVLTMRAEDAR